MMKKIKMMGIILYCSILALGAGISWLKPQKEYSDRENRMLETKPEFVLDEVLQGDYQKHYETYLNDQVFCRDMWVNMSAQLQRLEGKQEINGVWIGKDGYLLEKMQEADYDDAQVKENVSLLSDFLNEAVKRYGKKRVSCLMLPDKAQAIPDKLPAFAVLESGKADQAAASLQAKLRKPEILIRAQEALCAHAQEYIYYRTDHHWTTLGAYYAYCAWAQQTKHKAKDLAEYTRETVYDDFYGTTYNKAHVRVEPDQVEIFHHKNQEGVQVQLDDGEQAADSFYFPKEAEKGFDRYQIFFSKNTGQITVSTKANTGRNLLIIKDSFANCFVPFLAGDYDRIILVDFRYSKENIWEILEKHDEITDVMALYQVNQFMQDTNLRALDVNAKSMETFDADSFFDE